MNAWLDANLNPQIAAVWLDALLKSFVVLAFAAGLCLAWRRAAAATRHLIWFFGVVGLLMLPMLPFVLPTTTRPLWTVSGGQLSGNEMALSLELGPVKPSPAIAESVPGEHPLVQGSPASGQQLFKAHVSRNWVALGFGAWAFGALLVLLYPVVGRIQLLRMEKNAEALATSEWTALLAEASETLGLRRRVVLLQSRASVMPLTWGWLWPKVLMPAEAEQWPVERRRIVLLHELAHVKRRDCLTQSITRVVCALYWFNPLAWIAARQMRVERERACDDLVLNGGCKASEYAGHLVEIARTFRRAPQAAGIAMARSSNLEQRVTAIVDVSRARRLRPAGLVGILILIAAVVFYIGGYKTNAADNDRSSSLNQQTLEQIESFAAEKEAQAKMLAAAEGERILPEFQNYFDAAKRGDVQTVTNMYADLKKHHPQFAHRGNDKDSRTTYRTSYWQPMLEICLVYDHFAMSDAKYTQEAVRGIIGSIPAGAIYFGGTDPGRGLPTAFSKSHVNADPFYTISQNPLADDTYDEYLRNMYGEKRPMLAQLAAARQADPELSALNNKFQAAELNAFTLETIKPANDPTRQAAVNSLEELSSNIDVGFARVQKAVEADKNSSATNAWTSDKVIYIPTFADVQNCFQDYMEDARKRFDEKKLKPGENVQVDKDGHEEVSGQVAVMEVNARIAKVIFDKNPGRDFYVEESTPLDWMFPHLEPNGFIMKVNREALTSVPGDVIQEDEDFWQGRVNEWLGNWLTPETTVQTVADFATKTYGRKDLSSFTGEPEFVGDAYAPKMFSKWRSSIAGIYAWRLGYGPADVPPEDAPKSDAEKQRLSQVADFAFRQAFAICPFSPEVVFRYVNFLVNAGRKADALAIVHAAAMVDPNNATFRDLEKNLTQQIQIKVTASGTNKFATTAERLKELEQLVVQKEAAYNQQKTLYEKLKSQSPADLRKTLPIAYNDTGLNELLRQYDLAQQALIKLRTDYSPEHPKYKAAQESEDDLDRRINDRLEGVMLGLEAKVAYDREYVETVKRDVEEARKAAGIAQ